MPSLARLLALVLCGTATLLSSCYGPTSVACEGVPGGFCKEGYVCTAKQPFVCILSSDTCGNGTKDEGEKCDDGNRRAGDGCGADCGSTESCGNAVLDNAAELGLVEECDPALEDSAVGPSQDPKLASRDSARCDRDCTVTLCGDGYANEVSEQCDPREDNEQAQPDSDDWRLATMDSAQCNKNCTRAFCGDGTENSAIEIKDLGLKRTHVGEECDPGTGASDDRLKAAADSAQCDRDCTVVRCGDGVVNAAAGEECDPRVDNSGVAPTDNPKVASGNSALCDADCTWAKCGDGTVNELMEVFDLGSKKTIRGELCDPKQFGPTITATDNPQEASGDAGDCDRDCTWAECGDLYTNASEECDDGNKTSNDECSKDCKREECGNGLPDPGEFCDDGNHVGGDGCSADCKSNETCGDGVTTAGEDCDDKNDDNTDACVIVSKTKCFSHRCGDGFVYTKIPVNPADRDLKAEECDGGDYTIPGDDGESAACDADCSVAMCGDGAVNKLFPLKLQGGAPDQNDLSLGEKCDPKTGNTKGDLQLADTDSATCDRDCTVARCGDGYVNASYIVPGSAGVEVCDDGGESPTCDSNCTPAYCGDGDTNSKMSLSVLGTNASTADMSLGEKCDPKTGNSDVNGHRNRADADSLECDKDCTQARCGDGYLNTAAGSKELCDEGGESATCDADCTRPACGDGVVNLKFPLAPSSGGPLVGEQCDPGVNLGKIVTSGNPQLASEPSAACDVDCTAPKCGDGLTNSLAGEFCDGGGNSVSCDSDCTKAFCGDGFQNDKFKTVSLGTGAKFDGEFCDPATGAGINDQVASKDSADCDQDCTGVRCGDAHPNTEAGEECDNDVSYPNPPKSGDGCSSSCQKEECGNGRIDKVSSNKDEECDPNTGATSNRAIAKADISNCDSDCTFVGCNDGHFNPLAEECDDGNASNTPCDNNCKLQCGNGNKLPSEECDDGNHVGGDGCSATCKTEACGNGTVDVGEACDPGTGTTADPKKATAASASCSASCTVL